MFLSDNKDPSLNPFTYFPSKGRSNNKQHVTSHFVDATSTPLALFYGGVGSCNDDDDEYGADKMALAARTFRQSTIR
jgi:hypothetical protein